MTSAVLDGEKRSIGASGYCPPTVTPPAKRRGYVSAVAALARNPLTLWSQELYNNRMLHTELVGRKIVQLADPALIRRVLLEDYESFGRSEMLMRLLGPGLGEGLLTTDGEIWRRQRRIAAPAFRMQELRALTPYMTRAGVAAGRRLALAAQNREAAFTDVMPHMVRATFDVITDALLGGEGGESIDREAFAKDVDLYLNTVGRIGMLDVVRPLNWVPQPWKWPGYRATRRVRDTAAQAVAQRRAAGAHGDALIDRLIRAVDPEKAGGGLSDREVVDNIVTFFGAGHETTAVALTWTLSILAHQQEVQDALRAEVQAVAGDAPISAEHLERMTLHDQVIKESLRLYPLAAITSRSVVAKTELAGLRLKPGDNVVIPIYVLHRNNLLWDRPNEFHPSRFAADAPPVDRYAYLPFGGGPRICIGMTLALMEASAILAETLRRVRVAPGPERRIEPLLRVTLRPRGGMPLQLEPV